jgi:ABC-2 type transport system ATP-binding protein
MFWHGDLDALKESIVRIHIRRSEAFAADFSVANAFSQRTDGAYVTAVVSGWSNEQRRAVQQHSGGDVEVENLGLEDIFLELHR